MHYKNMNLNKSTIAIYIVLLITLLCNTTVFARAGTDNQTIIPKELKPFFSAKPKIENPVASNAAHQILIGIIDSGVDYNHPLLQSKVHYNLDKKNNIIGAGLDLVKKDNWPLPYLAETRHLYDKSKDQELLSLARSTQLNFILSLTPNLVPLLQSYRNYSKEIEEGVEHGTHVAGLASYDDNRIGIVPYRLMPQTEDYQSVSETGVNFKDYNEEFIVLLNQSIADAHAKGVKIINLSLSFGFNKSELNSERLVQFFKRFEKIVKAYPEMVIVTSSGNDGSFLDEKNKMHFPCGVNAENVICVSSLDKNGNLSEFTNIPLINTPIIYAPGEEIISTVPTYYCPSENIGRIQNYLTGNAFFVDPEKVKSTLKSDSNIISDAKKLAENLIDECSSISENIGLNKPNLLKMSGTSMSAPIVARLIAQKTLSLPNGLQLSGAEILNEFLKDAPTEKLGPLSLKKIRAPKPTWYSDEDENFVAWSANSNNNQSDFFEFYTTQTKDEKSN